MQKILAEDENVELLHHLEQVSTEGNVGSLAENLVEALIKFPEGRKKVEETREKTRMEKKRLALAMRQKQLESLGMMVRFSNLCVILYSLSLKLLTNFFGWRISFTLSCAFPKSKYNSLELNCPFACLDDR